MKIFSSFSLFLTLLLLSSPQDGDAATKKNKRSPEPVKQAQKNNSTEKEKKPKVEEPTPAEEESPIQKDTPQWEKSDQEKMLRGDLVTGEELLPDESDKIEEQEEVIPLDIPDEKIKEAEIPLEIPQELMPLYLPTQEGQYLLDPQKLLSEQEKADIEHLLDEIRGSTGVSAYLTIFTADQKIPASLNAPSLARQIFGDRSSCMLVEYRRGQFNSSQIVYSEDLGHNLNDNQRKSLLDGAKRAASEKSDDLDVLWSLLDAAGSQLPGIVNLAKTSPLAPRIAVPKVEYTLKPDEDTGKKSKKTFKINDFFISFWESYGSLILILFSLTAVLWGVIAYIKKRTVYAMESLPTNRQLGAPHGTGSTRILYYNTQQEHSKLEKDLLKDFFN